MSEEKKTNPGAARANHKPFSGTNKRKDPRRIVHERCIVQIYPGDAVEDTPPANEGFAIDISVGGLGLITSIPMDIGTKIKIEIKGRHFEHEFEAKVVWCGKLPSLGRIIKLPPSYSWRMGLVFEVRSDNDRDLIRSLAQSL